MLNVLTMVYFSKLLFIETILNGGQKKYCLYHGRTCMFILAKHEYTPPEITVITSK